MNEAAQRRLQSAIARDLARDCDGAFERFVLAYQDRIFAFCVGLSKDRNAAAELAQDTFVRAHTALKRYEPQRIRELSLRAWLYRIALNAAKNARRRKRFDLLDLDDAAHVRSAADTAHETEQRELARTVRAAVARLPAHLRAAVILRHLDDLPYPEISAITGQPEGTVKSHVHRGLSLLRKDLAHADS